MRKKPAPVILNAVKDPYGLPHASTSGFLAGPPEESTLSNAEGLVLNVVNGIPMAFHKHKLVS